MEKKLSLDELVQLRDSYEKEIEHLTMQLNAVCYVRELVVADLARREELSETY